MALRVPRRVQRSPLSDSVKDSFKKGSVPELLERLAKADVQAAQSDGDVDAVLTSLLKGRPDDLWVAQQIRKGQLGDTASEFGPQTMPKQPIEVSFVKGSTDRRALVVAGVHGSEVQGIEVAKLLLRDLQTAPQPPVFSTIIVPTLFPDNAAKRKREGATKTNRNFPNPGDTLQTVKRDKKNRPLDAKGRRILVQNLFLIALIERFKPERIISIHGTWRGGSGGVFFDPRSLSDQEVKDARAFARGKAFMHVDPMFQHTPEGQQQLAAFEERFFHERMAQLRSDARAADQKLSIDTATMIDQDTKGIAGRDKRKFANREDDKHPVPKAQVATRRAHPSVAGNVGPTGKLDHAAWSGSGKGGISLGGFGPKRGISVFTVEPPINSNSADYTKGKVKGDKGVGAIGRRMELQAYTDAIHTVLLGGTVPNAGAGAAAGAAQGAAAGAAQGAGTTTVPGLED